MFSCEHLSLDDSHASSRCCPLQGNGIRAVCATWVRSDILGAVKVLDEASHVRVDGTGLTFEAVVRCA